MRSAFSRIARRASPPTEASAVALRLFRDYYSEGKAKPVGASSHWAALADRFDVDIDESGQVVRLFGSGFGGSERASLPHRLLNEAFVLAQLTTLNVHGLREAVAAGRRTVDAMGLHFTQDAFRQACTSALLTDHVWKTYFAGGSPRTIVVIGDGPGILSALLHRAFSSAQVWLIDIGPTLLFQALHLERAFSEATHALAGDPAAAHATFVYCPAERLDRLPPEELDLAVNVASMQEMTLETVSAYFAFLRRRRTRLFYCCNRSEKRLPDGEVIRFLEYPWRSSDVHLLDEKCPWHQWWLGIGSSPAVRLAGIPIPLAHRYDGVHWHRLSRLDSGV